MLVSTLNITLMLIFGLIQERCIYIYRVESLPNADSRADVAPVPIPLSLQCLNGVARCLHAATRLARKDFIDRNTVVASSSTSLSSSSLMDASNVLTSYQNDFLTHVFCHYPLTLEAMNANDSGDTHLVLSSINLSLSYTMASFLPNSSSSSLLSSSSSPPPLSSPTPSSIATPVSVSHFHPPLSCRLPAA
jgi:hypothetical protein